MWWQRYFLALSAVSMVGCWTFGVWLFRRERFMSGCLAMTVMPFAVAGTLWFATLIVALARYGI